MGRTREFDSEMVLDEALRVFWEKGYEATSVQDLVAATGVNRASLYDTFGNKQKLFSMALDRFGSTRSLEKATAQAVPGMGRIRAALELAGKEASSDVRGCLVVNSIVERGAQDRAMRLRGRAVREQLERFFSASLADAERLGEIRQGLDRTGLARFLTNALFGLRVSAKTMVGRAAIQAIVENTLKTIG